MRKKFTQNVVASENIDFVRQEVLLHGGREDRFASSDSRVIDLLQQSLALKHPNPEDGRTKTVGLPI